MTRPQIILDTETTGLDPSRHEIWELALIERDCGAERLYRMEPHLTLADPAALKVGQYTERTKLMKHSLIAGSDYDSGVTDIAWTGYQLWSQPADLAPHIAGLLDGATLIAANPTFDAGFLAAFLAAHDCDPAPWHYRLRDIGSMARGWLQGRFGTRDPIPPMDAGTDDFARALGIDPDSFERHSALGDCRLVAAMLDAMEGGPR